MKLSRQRQDKYFYWLCKIVTYVSMLILLIILFHICRQGYIWLKPQFITNFPSRFPSRSGIKSALYGSFWLLIVTSAFAVPMGLATAIYLEEYGPKNRFMNWVEINISNLAGMPSIVYGLLGLAIFVRFFKFDNSILSGGLTLGLLVLPIIILTSKESIAAVPASIKEGAYALGARKWQVVFLQILPAALPGIMTGIILSLSRAIGETAPLIIVGAVGYAAFVPENIWDSFTALPIQIYNWSSRPQEDFHSLAATGIMVLLALLFTMNAVAVFIRNKYQTYR